jgi:hypothetical protein
MLSRTRFAEFAFIPSYWLSSSVLQWANGALLAAGFFVLVLLSHVAFFGMLAFTQMGSLFYDAASTVQSRASVFARWEWFHLLQRRKQEALYAIGPAERLIGRLEWLGPDVLARHHAMGAIAHALWTAGGLHL